MHMHTHPLVSTQKPSKFVQVIIVTLMKYHHSTLVLLLFCWSTYWVSRRKDSDEVLSSYFGIRYGAYTLWVFILAYLELFANSFQLRHRPPKGIIRAGL